MNEQGNSKERPGDNGQPVDGQGNANDQLTNDGQGNANNQLPDDGQGNANDQLTDDEQGNANTEQPTDGQDEILDPPPTKDGGENSVETPPKEPVETPPKEPKETYKGLVKRGHALLKAKNPRKALDTFQEALNMRENGVEALSGLGWSYLALNSLEAAEHYFKAAITQNRKYVDAYLGLGKTYQRQGHKDKAIALYRDFLELVPEGRQADKVRVELERLQ